MKRTIRLRGFGMLAIILKLMTLLWPFIKELLLSKKRHVDRRVPAAATLYYMIILMFIMLIISYSSANKARRELFNKTTELTQLTQKIENCEKQLSGCDDSLSDCSALYRKSLSMSPVEPKECIIPITNKPINPDDKLIDKLKQMKE